MSTVSDEPFSSARKSSQVLLRSLAKSSLDTLAKAISKDESTASRVRSGEARITVGEFCELVDAVGLKLVARDRVCVDRRKYEALATLAVAAMSDERTVNKLIWDGEE